MEKQKQGDRERRRRDGGGRGQGGGGGEERQWAGAAERAGCEHGEPGQALARDFAPGLGV
jgi:hypothetical protein